MKLKPHPYAELFPEATPEEMAAMVKDIREHGLMEIITIHEGQILDGRTRYEACLRAGRDPRYCDFTDHLPDRQKAGPLAYVMSRNFVRRHLNAAQRAMIAEKLADLPNHRPSKSANLPTNGQMPQLKAAQMLKVSDRSVRMARKIQREAPPEIVEAVKNGDMTLNTALKMIDPKTKVRISKKEPVFPTDRISKLISLASQNRHKFVCRIGEYRIRITREY